MAEEVGRCWALEGTRRFEKDRKDSGDVTMDRVELIRNAMSVHMLHEIVGFNPR